MFQVPTLPLCAVASPWRRGSVPELIDHRNRLYCGNKRRAPREGAISFFATAAPEFARRGNPLEIRMGLAQPLLGAFQQSRDAMHMAPSFALPANGEA